MAAAELGFLQKVPVMEDGKPTGKMGWGPNPRGGFKEYLKWLGIHHPSTFGALLSSARTHEVDARVEAYTEPEVKYRTSALRTDAQGHEPTR